MMRAVLFALLLFALTGCRLAQVEVGSAPTPAPTAAPQILSEGSTRSQDDLSAWDDEETVITRIASPRIVFTESAPYIEPFPNDTHSVNYLLVDTGMGYRVRAEWDGVWLEGAHGTTALMLIVSVKPQWEAEYTRWAEVTTGEIEEWGASYHSELLDATLYFPQAGRYQVRAELSIYANLIDVLEDARSLSFAETVIGFNAPAEPPTQDARFLTPKLGDLENSDSIFLDWRAWGFGPCDVRGDNPTLTQRLDETCLALESGDLEAAAQALQDAITAADDDPLLQGSLRDQLGILAATAGRWNIAARHFRQALDLWEAHNAPVQTARALHNLGIALIQTGRWEEGSALLFSSAQLCYQLQDWIGATLTWAQFSVFWGDTASARSNADDLANYGLPQADSLRAWADWKDAQPTDE